MNNPKEQWLFAPALEHTCGCPMTRLARSVVVCGGGGTTRRDDAMPLGGSALEVHLEAVHAPGLVQVVTAREEAATHHTAGMHRVRPKSRTSETPLTDDSLDSRAGA